MNHSPITDQCLRRAAQPTPNSDQIDPAWQSGTLRTSAHRSANRQRTDFKSLPTDYQRRRVALARPDPQALPLSGQHEPHGHSTPNEGRDTANQRRRTSHR